MSEPDRSRDRERSIRWDDWPIERSDPPDVTREGGTGASTADDYVADDDAYEWIGVSAQTGDPYILEPHGRAIYQGEIDEENERIVLREDDRRELSSEQSLGERIEELGDDHGWERLSSFAREHLEDDDRLSDDGQTETDDARELTVRHTNFEERNMADSADHDVGFTATHTLEDRSGRVHVVERRFDVREEGTHGVVDVQADYLVAEEPREEDRAGDAELVAQREDQFEVDLETDREDWEVKLREDLEEWHETHVDWPDGADR